jgi:hypothetical protein
MMDFHVASETVRVGFTLNQDCMLSTLVRSQDHPIDLKLPNKCQHPRANYLSSFISFELCTSAKDRLFVQNGTKWATIAKSS